MKVSVRSILTEPDPNRESGQTEIPLTRHSDVLPNLDPKGYTQGFCLR